MIKSAIYLIGICLMLTGCEQRSLPSQQIHLANQGLLSADLASSGKLALVSSLSQGTVVWDLEQGKERWRWRQSDDQEEYVTLTRFVRLALQSLALGVGALLAVNNQISAGSIFAASFLIARALAPIEQMLGAWKGLSQARGAYRSLTDLFVSEAAQPPRTQLPPPTGGSVTFDGISRFIKVQISHKPYDWLALVGASLALAGLLGSLFIRSRRVWIRVRRDDATGRTLVEIGGLDRSSHGGLDAELDALVADLESALSLPAAGGSENKKEI